MIKIASNLDPLTIVALTDTSPSFSYLLCVFTSHYTMELDDYGESYTPLQYFISCGIEHVVTYLLDSGTDANRATTGPSKHQRPPLMVAVRHNQPHMIPLLVRYGARVDDRVISGEDFSGFTPLHLALARHSKHQRRRSSAPDDSPARSACVLQIVEALLDAGADATARTLQCFTPLHIACGTWDIDPVVVALLIGAGADIRCRAPSRSYVRDSLVQPIHLAAAAGNTAVVEILLNAGVDVEAVTWDGARALDLAILGMHPDTLQLLVDGSADMSTTIHFRTRVPQSRDPLVLVGNQTRWVELTHWFRSRGWRDRGRGLVSWAWVSASPDSRREEICGFPQEW